MHTIQAQLSTPDLLKLADLKDLIAEGKRDEALPGLYTLAAKYPQSKALQALIRVSLNPEILSEPEVLIPTSQQFAFTFQPITHPQWGTPPPVYQPLPNGYLQPFQASTPNYIPTPTYNQNLRPLSVGNQFLYCIRWFAVCLIVLITIFSVDAIIVGSIQQNAGIAIRNAYTYYGADLARASANDQINTVNTLTWVVFFSVIISSTIWATLDSNKVRQKYGTKVVGNALVTVLVLGWAFGLPLYLTYRRRALYPYVAKPSPIQRDMTTVPSQSDQPVPKRDDTLLGRAIALVIIGVIFFLLGLASKNLWYCYLPSVVAAGLAIGSFSAFIKAKKL